MPERKKLLLRLDPDVYDAVARWAADDLRSVNAQIEYALRLALRANGRAPRKGPAGTPDSRPPDGDDPLSGDGSDQANDGDPAATDGSGHPKPDHGP
jgi:hypothetical protein